MPSLSEVITVKSLVAQLSAAAVAAVRAMWAAGQEGTAEQYPLLVDPYVSAAGLLATQWYASLDESSLYVPESAVVPTEVLRSNANWALRQADPITMLTDAADRQVFRSARNTLVVNAEREGVKYARHASANACPWCRVMATRGAVYHGEDTATAGHDNCHCIAVPIRSGDFYEPPPYVNDWTDQYNAARDEVGGNLKDIVNHMRKVSPQGD